MNSAEYLDIRVKIESMQQTLSQTAMDINIIKCLLITEFAQKRGINAHKLAEDIRKVYGLDKEETKEDE